LAIAEGIGSIGQRKRGICVWGMRILKVVLFADTLMYSDNPSSFEEEVVAINFVFVVKTRLYLISVGYEITLPLIKEVPSSHVLYASISIPSLSSHPTPPLPPPPHPPSTPLLQPPPLSFNPNPLSPSIPTPNLPKTPIPLTNPPLPCLKCHNRATSGGVVHVCDVGKNFGGMGGGLEGGWEMGLEEVGSGWKVRGDGGVQVVRKGCR